ncbi:MAG: hypothetical protein NC112_01945 [Oxalobacter formigenes]|nr:hypothetical protein [Oxalobacter formigenes]
MKRALQAGVCLFLFALCAFSQAASLGRLTVLSSLGQPLRAEVEILDAAGDEAANLAVALAPAEAYKRSGLDYSSLLQTLDITVVQEGERRFARIRSAQPVSEPYIGLLLELAAGQARKGREYALTLDAAERTSLRSAPLSSAASLERLSRQQRVERLFTRNIPADAARPAAVLGSQESQKTLEKPAASRYVVARGDTLSKIAARLGRRDISLEQMLVALYRNNPGAFLDNNMNLLKEGAPLSIPDVDDGENISRSEARSVVRLHAANFSDYSQKLAGMVRKSSSRSTPAAGPVAEGRISAQVKEQPTPASRLPDRLELSKVRPGEQPSGMTVEEKVAITQAVEENRHRIVELEKNVGELKNLLEIVSESGAAFARPAQTPADMKAGGQKKTPPATDKTAKGRDATPVSDGRKDVSVSDAGDTGAGEKEGIDPNQTLAGTPEKAASSEEKKKAADENEDESSYDDEDDDEDDDENENEENGDNEASGGKRQGQYGLNNRLVWLVAAGVTALLLALIAGLAVMRRKKAAVQAKASMREETALREEPEEALNPNIISGREFLENLPAPDLDEDAAGGEASDSVEGVNEADEAAAEGAAGEFEEVEFPQVEESLQDESDEVLEAGQETEPEADDVPSFGEGGEDEPFVSLDQASVENEVLSQEAGETVQAALPPDSMALPEALTEEAVLPEEEREAFGAEALADVGNAAENETDKTSQDALEEAAAEEVDNTEKARALELDLSDIDLSAVAEDGGADVAGLQADTDAGTAEAEMAAKLELAMAYLDMKDKDGARELLEEVMEKGTPRQAEEAAQAMQSL